MKFDRWSEFLLFPWLSCRSLQQSLKTSPANTNSNSSDSAYSFTLLITRNKLFPFFSLVLCLNRSKMTNWNMNKEWICKLFSTNMTRNRQWNNFVSYHGFLNEYLLWGLVFTFLFRFRNNRPQRYALKTKGELIDSVVPPLTAIGTVHCLYPWQ